MKKLKAKLDKVFSVYIRTRTADFRGYVKCFTCPKMGHWKEFDCGHYQSRRYLPTRWDEKNCQVQCKKCNIFNQGSSDVFALRLIEKYGPDILSLLQIKKNNLCKMGRFEYGILIKE